jgi:hypothetical protein
MYCLYIPYSSFIIALKPTRFGMYPLHEKRKALLLFIIKIVKMGCPALGIWVAFLKQPDALTS